jgi:transposase
MIWKTTAKLAPQQVKLARDLHASGASCAAIARQLGVSTSNVSLITTGKAWRGPRAERGESPGARLTGSEVEEIRDRARHEPLAKIAAHYGVAYSTAWRISTGRSWREAQQ